MVGYEPAFVKKMFNRMSSSYERMNYITSFGFSIRWRRQFLEKLGKSNQHLNLQLCTCTCKYLYCTSLFCTGTNDICSLHY
ncbi:class I SAM-dependent methyltransferase [Sphingobacterium arenae]|uniref:Class I SAM-dependent methyltransferase n=1 Tax=Sphingobacterium arenae TaxID=1280598 RepID=A0ABR7Y4G8_9SPHI|nr:class I SAM-dependent methyltransferase [Sphingobacterium arenae]